MSSTNATAADFTALLQQEITAKAHPIFGLEQLEDVLSWTGPVGGSLRARILSALQTSASSTDVTISTVCARAIAEVEQWADLAAELVRYSEINPDLMMTIAMIAKVRSPTHPLAAMENPPAIAVAVFDAMDDGDMIHVSADRGMGSAGEWLLLDMNDPVNTWTTATALQRDTGEILLSAGQVPWLERHRTACPAFIAVSL
jgi:hypothetical protein